MLRSLLHRKWLRRNAQGRSAILRGRKSKGNVVRSGVHHLYREQLASAVIRNYDIFPQVDAMRDSI